MDKIVLRFWRNKNVVMMQVIQQDKLLRGEGEILYNEEDYMTIESSRRPDLTFNSIFIRGEIEACDNNISCINLETERDAKDYLMRCIRTINRYNNSLINAKTAEKEEEIIILIVE